MEHLIVFGCYSLPVSKLDEGIVIEATDSAVVFVVVAGISGMTSTEIEYLCHWQ